jgi:hypothetical protein
MAVDLTVILENRPGTLADLGEALGKAGINMDGLCGVPCAGEDAVHVLVADGAAARRVLAAAGFEVRAERPVLLVQVANRPGELGRVCRQIANAGVNIDLVYPTSGTVLAVGVDDLDKAQIALEG